jgi:hypothetical protein
LVNLSVFVSWWQEENATKTPRHKVTLRNFTKI